MWAIVFVVALALRALQTRPDLGTDTSTVADLECRDLGSNFYDLANDLMTDCNGCWRFTPASCDGMYIGTADTTALDLDVDIVVTESLWLELLINGQQCYMWTGQRQATHALLLEVLILSQLIDHKTFELLWIRHDCGMLL